MRYEVKRIELMAASDPDRVRASSSLRNRGFTLIELMVVMIIVSILTSLSFVALRGAQQDSNYAKTRATIRKIESIITDRFEEYRNIGLDYSIQAGAYTSTSLPRAGTGTQFNNGGVADGLLHARIRLGVLRDLMRLEMPDTAGDIVRYDGTNFVFRSPNSFPSGYTYIPNGSPVTVTLNNAPRYSQLQSVLFNRHGFLSSGVRCLNPGIFERNFNAELLFLIVESSYVAGTFGIESFSDSEIRDTDNDGLREFVDAWGNPIQWLRWPAGYFDDAERSQTGGSLKGGASAFVLNRYDPDPLASQVGGQAVFAKDDFDPTSADIGYLSNDIGNHPTAPLRPLIVSPGPDGRTGLRFFWTGSNAQAGLSSLFTVADAQWSGAAWPDPFYPRPGTWTGYDEDYNQSLGGVLNVELDGTDVPVGFDATGAFIPEPSPDVLTNPLVRRLVSDNVTNFDELGGAL